MPATSKTATAATSKTAPSAPPPAQTPTDSSTVDKGKCLAEITVRFYEKGKPVVTGVRIEKLNHARIQRGMVAIFRAVGKKKVDFRRNVRKVDQAKLKVKE